jgi:uncharacterized protein
VNLTVAGIDDDRISVVDYLDLDPAPHLKAWECLMCKARYFDHRDGCARCSGDEFHLVNLPTSGELVTFSIVRFAAAGVAVPFVAAVVSCDGTWVRTNLVDVEPDPSSIHVGMPVELSTYSLGADPDGLEAIGFGFRPA